MHFKITHWDIHLSFRWSNPSI